MNGEERKKPPCFLNCFLPFLVQTQPGTLSPLSLSISLSLSLSLRENGIVQFVFAIVAKKSYGFALGTWERA